MRKLLVFIMVILPLVGILASSCTGTTEKPGTTTATTATTATTLITTPAPQTGGRLRIMISAGPGSPIGWPAESVGPALVYTKPCLESLLFEDTNGQIKPWLATEWKIAEDQKSITFTLRKGVKFHDGSDFNAQAVKFSLESLKNAKKSGTDIWTSLEAVDDYTFRLGISKFQNTILNNLSESGGLIISPTAYQNKGIDWVRWNPVGTGSFKFNSFSQDVALKYDRFDSYWQKGKPYLDGIDYVIVKDALTQMAAFQRGEADILNAGQPKQASDLQAMGYQMIYTPTNTACLIPDSKNADSPFANLKVRQAVEYAINKDDMVKALGYGFWKSQYQYAVPTQSAFIKDLAERKFDVAKAKQLLTEAGFSNGFTTTLIPDPQSSNSDAMTAIQAALKTIGIEAAIENVAVGKYSDYRAKGWKNALLCQAIGVNTPNVAGGMVSVLSASAFASLKHTPAYLAALDEALSATNYDQQLAATRKAGQAIYDDEMIIPLFAGVSCYALQKGVHDTGLLTTSHFTIWAYYNAWLEKQK